MKKYLYWDENKCKMSYQWARARVYASVGGQEQKQTFCFFCELFLCFLLFDLSDQMILLSTFLYYFTAKLTKKNFDPKRLYFKNIAIIIFISYIFYQKALTSGFRMIPYFNSFDIYKYVKYLFISARFFEPKNWPIQRHRSLRNPMLRVNYCVCCVRY